jgi:DNA topoisomerase I
MAKNLLIVESPAKAKTIESYLGKDFTVKSSFGHIRDLKKGNDAIQIDKNYLPIYEVSKDKEAVVKELRKMAKEAEMVWLASDEDREGEAISWHLYETLGLKSSNTKRIVFHEITKPAILKAIENPRFIDENLVNAQQARRVLDRLVGFEISPVLWRKVKPSLSAGRVQSVAVRLIVEREREVIAFNAESFYKTIAIFKTKEGKSFKAELNQKFETLEQAQAFVQACSNANFSIESTEVKPAKKSPAPPFTTSTLQQEASRKLGFSVSRTMSVAQRLYEAGKITYMRTDSVNLSDTALGAAQNEITSAYGKEFHQFRKYKTKSANAQEAHEAIRPTYFNQHTITDMEAADRRLYELIWKRAIASQMAEAELEKTVVKISVSNQSALFVAEGEVIKFEGFLKVYLESQDDEGEDEENSGMLPKMGKGDSLSYTEITSSQKFSRPPARYNEASLVKKLEEMGIGRPSTYAPTISTIQNRNYVIREDRDAFQRVIKEVKLNAGTVKTNDVKENYGAERSKLFPTDIGVLVTDFLVQHFQNIVDYNFTAKVEEEFDEIARGLKDWTKMIDSFYKPFHKEVENTLETAERQTGERELGTDPVSGKKVSVRIGRYGPFAQIGESSETEKPSYASLKTGQLLETITLEEALELFKFPRTVGTFEGEEMQVALGRFGPYIKHKSAFYSLAKTDDPGTIVQERAIELILAKRQKDAERIIQEFHTEKPPITIENGRWGPFIRQGKNNYKIPKNLDAHTIGLEDVKALIAQENSGAKTKKGTKTSKGAKKK